MSGSIRLSDSEVDEMRADARSAERRTAFAAARQSAQSDTMDEYIDFLSANMGSVPKRPPRAHKTDDFRL